MGQFNNGYRRPNFSGSKDFYSPSNSSLAPVPASQPKSKKKLLIIVAILAIVLISLFAIIGTLNNSNQQAKWNNHANSETNNAFNRLANWILFGEDSDEKFTEKEYGQEYDEYHVYYGEEMINAEDPGAFFEKALELAKVFDEKFVSDGGINQVETLDAGIISYGLEFLVQYFKTRTIDPEDENKLEMLYFEKGYDESLKYIEAFYQPYRDLDNAYAEDFAKENIINDENKIKMVDIYYRKGCIDTNLNEGPSCNITAEDSASLQSYMTENSNLSINRDSMFINHLVMIIERFCWMTEENINE